MFGRFRNSPILPMQEEELPPHSGSLREGNPMTAMSKTVFTIEDANRTLPLVRSIVSDVADRWKDLVKVRDEYGNSSPEHDQIMRELAEYIQELKEIGCHLKDFERGLVDFPAIVDNNEVLLSWKLGEDEITHIAVGEGDSADRAPLPGLENDEPSSN
jgi:hypothetical protein